MTWNPFKKKDEAQKPIVEETSKPAPNERKGRPTPKMKAAQASNIRPLVPDDRKASAKAARARIRERENREYEAMRKGDINNMPKAERLPWRIYIRDYVDARYNVGEFFIPVAFTVLILTMVITTAVQSPLLSMVVMGLLYVYFFVIIIDVALMWRKLKRKLIDKFGEASVARGSRSATYAWSRAIQMRRWRLPKPRYPKRGHYPQD